MKKVLIGMAAIALAMSAQATIYAEMQTAADGSTFTSASSTKGYNSYFITLNTMKSDKVMNESDLTISDVDRVASWLKEDFDTNIKKVTSNAKSVNLSWYSSQKAMESRTEDGGAYYAGKTFIVYTYSASSESDTYFRVASWNNSSVGMIKDWSSTEGLWTAWNAPEPTSGLLMLLGIAGLALKRKRA